MILFIWVIQNKSLAPANPPNKLQNVREETWDSSTCLEALYKQQPCKR